MSSVTSFFARSSWSFDSASVVLATVKSTLSVVSASTSIDPHTLSISSDLWPGGITNDFWIFSWSRTGKSRSRSSRSFAEAVSGPNTARSTLTAPREPLLAYFPAGNTGKSSATAVYIPKIAKNRFRRTLASLVQSAQRPIGALPHRRIQIRCLHKISQPLRRIRITPFEHQVDQRHLHERRLLLLQRV